MQTREDKNITSKFSKTLNQAYHWFDTKFSHLLSETFSEFWNKDISVKLLSISENANFLEQGEEFFVTQIRLNKELSVFVRLSKELVKNLLEKVLGPNGKNFNIEKITELEAKILTGFDNLLYKNFSHLIKQNDELPQNNNNYNECNLTFYLQSEGQSFGKIVVKIPTVAITPKLIQTEEEKLTINNFLDYKTEVTICAGYSRIKLNDIKTLEKDDVVLLENSVSNKMILKYNGLETEFKISPNPLIMIDYDIEYDGENSGGHKAMSNNLYNMWDSIQVEIGAEFEKTKLTLGELKQISEGLIVDIGSIYDNKIDLKVEDKIVASGELVIINDRYGVRINEIFTEEETPMQANMPTERHLEQPEQDFSEETYEETETQENSYQNEEADTQSSDDEDFDYSNFDIDEDEDL